MASRIAALIRQNRFLTPEEKEQLAQREEAQRLADAPEDTVDDDEPIDTEAVRQRLAESGIVGGEVVDAEALNILSPPTWTGITFIITSSGTPFRWTARTSSTISFGRRWLFADCPI